jgi:hypothetical protein
MPIPNDTSPEAEKVLRQVYRTMPFGRRWALLSRAVQESEG